MTAPTTEPPCPITDRIMRSEVKRRIVNHSQALKEEIAGLNFHLDVAITEQRARPGAQLFEADDPAVQTWCDYWWRRAMWGIR